jgi:hypothetical protein
METHSQYLRLVSANVSDEGNMVTFLLLGQIYTNRNVISTRKRQYSKTKRKEGTRIL